MDHVELLRTPHLPLRRRKWNERTDGRDEKPAVCALPFLDGCYISNLAVGCAFTIVARSCGSSTGNACGPSISVLFRTFTAVILKVKRRLSGADDEVKRPRKGFQVREATRRPRLLATIDDAHRAQGTQARHRASSERNEFLGRPPQRRLSAATALETSARLCPRARLYHQARSPNGISG